MKLAKVFEMFFVLTSKDEGEAMLPTELAEYCCLDRPVKVRVSWLPSFLPFAAMYMALTDTIVLFPKKLKGAEFSDILGLIVHEFTHVNQFRSGRLKSLGFNKYEFDGEVIQIPFRTVPQFWVDYYTLRKWEVEAEIEGAIASTIFSVGCSRDEARVMVSEYFKENGYR